MFTSGQLLYLDEVLGTTPAAFRTADLNRAAAPAERPTGVIVRTPDLGPLERELLIKILGSVALTDYAHVEGCAPAVGAHVLNFAAGDAPAVVGRSEANGVVTWGFPPLARMLGTSAEVTRLKRETWTLLQEFRRSV